MSEFIPLRLADGLHAKVDRIGYPDEGLRLHFFRHIPFKFHVEVQLSGRDTEALIKALQDQLNYHRDRDLPE